MAQIAQLKTDDIEELVKLAREEVKDSNIIPWIIERSPEWRNRGYTELKAAIEAANVEL